MSVKMRSVSRILDTISASFKLGWASSSSRLTAIALLSFASAITVVISIAVQKEIVDAVGRYVGMASMIAIPVTLIVFRFLVLVADDLIEAFRDRIISHYSMDLENKLVEKCAVKAARIDLINYEDAGLYNRIEKAHQGSESVSGVALILISLVTSLLATLIGVTGYLLYLNPILALILLFSLVPSVIVRLFLARVRARVVDETAAPRRSLTYASACIASREHFKETRVLGAFSFFLDKWEKSRRDIDRAEWRFHSRDLTLRCLEWTCLYLGYALSFVLAAHSLFTGEISVGTFAAVLAALGHMQSSALAIVSDLGDAFAKGAIAGAYFDFFNLPERRRGEMRCEDDCEIRLEGVGFKYPSAESPCLKDIDLTVRPRETLAVVGANGAGKTTLAKIVVGLLEPSTGKVFRGSTEITHIAEELLFKRQSAVFQDFGKYKMTLRENVALGDISALDDDRKIGECLDRMGFDVSKPEYRENGFDTLLAPDFGGIDISGGEWQLVSIARADLRDHSFIVLDEPTSSIDPIREAEIYRKFIEMSRDRMALIITHRLGAATLADRIIFVESGRIRETGTHEQLMSMDGHYATMFRAQAKWYTR